MKRIFFCAFLLFFTLFSVSGSQLNYQRKLPRTMIFSRAQYHYNPVLNYSGRWVDIPLLLDPKLNDINVSGTTSYAALMEMEKITREYGLDGLASLYGKGTARLIKMLEKNAVPGFHLLPEVYPQGRSMYAPNEVALKDIRKYLDPVFLPAMKSSVTLKHNGKTIISSYNADDRPPEFYKALLENYRKTEGDNFLFLPLLERPDGIAWHRWCAKFNNGFFSEKDLNTIKEHFRKYLRVTDGLYLGCGPVKSNNDRHTDMKFFRLMIKLAVEVMNEPEFKDKLFAIAARLGHENASRVGYIRGSYGTWCYRGTLEAALEADPDIIVIPEWDEQNENTSLRPTRFNMSSFKRLTRHYQKMSADLPGDDLSIPNIFVSYRKVVALGEMPEFELLRVPDTVGQAEAVFKLFTPEGKEIFSSCEYDFSGKELTEYRFSIDSASWAAYPYLLPELTVKYNGKTTVYRDCLQYIKIEPVSNCDYQFAKQPLRDLIADPEVKIETTGKNRYKISFASKEAIAFAEISDDNMPIYSATKANRSYFQDSAKNAVFTISVQNFHPRKNTLKGSFSVSGAKNPRWMFDNTVRWPTFVSSNIPLDKININESLGVEMCRWFLTIPQSDVDKAVLKIDLPGFFDYSLPLAQVTTGIGFGVPGKSTPVMSVCRQDFQILQVPRLNLKRTAFEKKIVPHSKNAVHHFQVFTTGNKVWRSRPLNKIAVSEKKGKIQVYSEKERKAVTLDVPESLIPVYRYEYTPGIGNAMPCSAGRRFAGAAGGYPAQYSGRLGARRDSTVFIAAKDFPANAKAAAADLLENSWGFSKNGQHLALPSGVISRRAAFKLTILLKQDDNSGVQTILDNRASQPGLLKILSKNGKLHVEFVDDTLTFFRYDTGLTLEQGKWSKLELDYALDKFTISIDGKKFSGKCSAPGLCDTVTSLFGGREGFFKGECKFVEVDYRR